VAIGDCDEYPGEAVACCHPMNASLLAAAPALLEPCKAALDFVHAMPYEPSNAHSTKLQDALVDAIDRAEGRA